VHLASTRIARSTIAALTVVGAVVVAAPSALGAAEATTATIRASLAPNRLGAKAAFSFAIHYAGGELGVPSPVRRAVVHFPAGLKLDIPSVQDCDRAKLQAHGESGCPVRSQLGGGRATADVHVGSEVETEEATVWTFLGPLQDGEPTIEILGQGYTPLDERVVMSGTVLPDRAPYGEKLVISIPTIPTLPDEPAASPVSLSLTVGGKLHSGKRGAGWVVVPPRCPAGGFPFAAEFSYADGSTSRATARAPCP
jgi:hypothetical protein